MHLSGEVLCCCELSVALVRMREAQIPCLLRRDVVNFGTGLFDGVCDVCYVLACCSASPSRLEKMITHLQIFRLVRRASLPLSTRTRATKQIVSSKTKEGAARPYVRRAQEEEHDVVLLLLPP